MGKIQPGLIALHSHRTETLAETVFAWLRQHPLAPLEEEIVLVQSNGMAEWFKMMQARSSGLCAGARVELPSRFLWRTYRQVLGHEKVPSLSPLDKMPMTWRLMQHLPTLLTIPSFEPVAGFLRTNEFSQSNESNESHRLLQLAVRLADLFDQYQVYRPDWLTDWEAGHDVLRAPCRPNLPVPTDQCWQPMLWRAILETLNVRERGAIRPHIHQSALSVLQQPLHPNALAHPVARRVVLFGTTQVPLPVLQMLAALAGHCQVLLAIPNPCRFHWADTMDGRELLRIQRRRQPLRHGRDLAVVPLEQMHIHAHPLLAAWGRQGRDFIRQLDEFDDAEQAQKRFSLPRVDLFDEEEDTPQTPLLTQIQYRIRDLVPLAEHPVRAIDSADRSVVFHIAHGILREVEVLHDQLLHLLADTNTNTDTGTAPLRPRDVVVMVPHIDTVAPAIRAVFGQYERHDSRFIPFDIADLSARVSSPIVGALEWLLHLPQQRCCLSELRDLLDVPGVAARFGVAADALPRLTQWMLGAGIRWGLNEAQRVGLDLAACGAQNTGDFGVRRMLLGYASGGVGFAGVEPYVEVGGLEAELAGVLAQLLHRLEQWRAQASTSATPPQWAERGRSLLADLIMPTDETDREVLDALDTALTRWQEACVQAGFVDEIPLPIAREAWLEALQEPSLQQRFRAGGVTFCTLMPMRAIPFEVVCLLGMNDGDYPRRAPRSDFDLMGLPGQARPGDRSRQSDDRQLMLEALLSARRALYISWAGRSVRDHSEQPPSVLVSQLRDYLAAGWGGDVLAQRTTEHPLQPFSRSYFEGRSDLWTYAREWRSAHTPPPMLGAEGVESMGTAVPAWVPDVRVPLTMARLGGFLRHPVKVFFRERLGVVFGDVDEESADEESFGLGGLQEYGVVQELIQGVLADTAQTTIQNIENIENIKNIESLVTTRLESLRRAGRLPLGGFAERTQKQLTEILLPLLNAWQSVQNDYPELVARVPLRYALGELVLEDWLDHLYRASPSTSHGESVPVPVSVWLEQTPSKLLKQPKQGQKPSAVPLVSPDKVLLHWVRSLAAAACGVAVQGVLVGRDATLNLRPIEPESAKATLAHLLKIWHDGMQAPLPMALRTGLIRVEGGDVVGAYEGSYERDGDVAEPCLARVFPHFEALSQDGRFELLVDSVYRPLVEWVKTHVQAIPHSSNND